MFRFSPNPNAAHRIRWREWGTDAFEDARPQNKPVMLFLGAFWCGICQRMDETTLSSEEVIALLNAYFVPVRVEEAERPDIDLRYNENGWPTVVFLSPSGDYLASVNYLSADDFIDILVRVHVAQQKRNTAAQNAGDARKREVSGPAPAVRPEAVREIAEKVLAQVDPIHGGYGFDRKFPHCEVNEFLLKLYERTGDERCLKHVQLTLSRMRDSKTHDEEGGFFRYSSKRDWSEPHREKLLGDHAGLLCNALHLFELTGEAFFRQIAEEIVGYLEGALRDSRDPFFHGCRDYIRLFPGRDLPEGATLHQKKAMFSVTDPWLYTDANARTVSAYLEAARILERKELRERALETLHFLNEHCYDPARGMAHCFDDTPRVWGLLTDQICAGQALVAAFEAVHDPILIEQVEALATFVQTHLKNPEGGFFDVAEKGPAHLRYPLTLLTENGAAASFFVKLYSATKKSEYREAAEWALRCFDGDFTDYGLHAAEYGLGLQAYLELTRA